MVGVALLGGGISSLALGVALLMSTIWKNGWWLYLQPEVAPLVFLAMGSTMDVALGFLVSSLIKVKTHMRYIWSPSTRMHAATQMHASGLTAVHAHRLWWTINSVCGDFSEPSVKTHDGLAFYDTCCDCAIRRVPKASNRFRRQR